MHFLIYGGIAVAAGASIPILVGFGSAGIVAGSIAAGVQSSMGTVAAGSLFSITQSLAMQGVFVYSTIAGTAVAGSGVVYEVVRSNDKENNSSETSNFIQSSNKNTTSDDSNSESSQTSKESKVDQK